MFINALIAFAIVPFTLISAGAAPRAPKRVEHDHSPESAQCYTRIGWKPVAHPHSTTSNTYWSSCVTTSTKTVTKTNTITPTSTVTTTTTTTTTISTVSTVPAPATFTPVQTSLPGSTYSGSGGADPAGKRDLTKKRAYYILPRSPNGGYLVRADPNAKSYPQGVHCDTWKPPPQCHTKVVTVTSTAHVAGPASLKTVTSTSTATTTTYTSTIYAACASNNLADTYTGGTHFVEGEGGFETVASTNTDTAYDCCVAALLDNGGDTNVWVFEPSTGECDIGETDGTCPAPATNPSTVITSPDGTLVIGNAYCGEFDVAVPEFSGVATV